MNKISYGVVYKLTDNVINSINGITNKRNATLCAKGLVRKFGNELKEVKIETYNESKVLIDATYWLLKGD